MKIRRLKPIKLSVRDTQRLADALVSGQYVWPTRTITRAELERKND